jgi:hypothetical protein
MDRCSSWEHENNNSDDEVEEYRSIRQRDRLFTQTHPDFGCLESDTEVGIPMLVEELGEGVEVGVGVGEPDPRQRAREPELERVESS